MKPISQMSSFFSLWRRGRLLESSSGIDIRSTSCTSCSYHFHIMCTVMCAVGVRGMHETRSRAGRLFALCANHVLVACTFRAHVMCTVVVIPRGRRAGSVTPSAPFSSRAPGARAVEKLPFRTSPSALLLSCVVLQARARAVRIEMRPSRVPRRLLACHCDEESI